MDRSGNAVACALTMDNLFGTGRILPGLGFLAAASPAAVPPPLLSAGLVWNDNIKAFRAAAGGSGQAGAPLAVALALINTLKTNQPMSVPVPDPGRANVIACGRYLPGENSECGWANDPRESGLAWGPTDPPALPVAMTLFFDLSACHACDKAGAAGRRSAMPARDPSCVMLRCREVHCVTERRARNDAARLRASEMTAPAASVARRMQWR